MKARLENGEAGWIGLIVYVVAYDLWQWRHDRPTLSIVFGRWCQRRPGKVLLAAAWSITTTHLFIGKPAWWHLPERGSNGTTHVQP